MEKTIEQIIKKIPKGCYFDSHYVIRMLILKYPDEYNKLAKVSTLPKHSRIAKLIKKCKYAGLKKDMISFSENIKARGSKCALWQRK